MIRVTIARQRAMRIARLFCTEVMKLMKRTIAALILGLSLFAGACTTAVVVRPVRAAVWVPAHYEYFAFHRVWVAAHWRY
ncbi:MAG TPA: hypothetical protein VGA10_01790 [Thermoanaerobaculia bacterium]